MCSVDSTESNSQGEQEGLSLDLYYNLLSYKLDRVLEKLH